MTFSLALPADHRKQPKPAGVIGPDPDHTDFELMIRLYHGGPKAQSEAFKMADMNYSNSRKERDSGSQNHARR